MHNERLQLTGNPLAQPHEPSRAPAFAKDLAWARKEAELIISNNDLNNKLELNRKDAELFKKSMTERVIREKIFGLDREISSLNHELSSGNILAFALFFEYRLRRSKLIKERFAQARDHVQADNDSFVETNYQSPKQVKKAGLIQRCANDLFTYQRQNNRVMDGGVSMWPEQSNPWADYWRPRIHDKIVEDLS